MSSPITPRTTLDNLTREAKRWFKALRANLADARARFHRVLPIALEPPALRDLQHALALGHALPGCGYPLSSFTLGS